MRPLFETLESREFLSASIVKHAAKPLPQHTHHAHKAAVHAAAAARTVTKKTAKTTTATTTPAPVTWNDVAGNWAGTFSNNIGASGAMSASFQNRRGVSNTGTFNLSAMIGQSGLLTTTTPDQLGNVLVTIPVKGGSVSLVAGITYDGQTLSGRWCSHIGTEYVTGIFTMHRV